MCEVGFKMCDTRLKMCEISLECLFWPQFLFPNRGMLVAKTMYLFSPKSLTTLFKPKNLGNFVSGGQAPSCDILMLLKVGGDGAVTNDTEEGDGNKVEGDENEVEGDNEGDEKEETAEEETFDGNLADEGDIAVEVIVVWHNKAVFQLVY